LKSNEVEVHKSLLKNWILFGLFFVVDFYLDYIFSWLPFYYECKLLVMFWLACPHYHGAAAVYTTYLQPFLEAYEPHIDLFIATSKQRVKEHIQFTKLYLLEFIQKSILLFVSKPRFIEVSLLTHSSSHLSNHNDLSSLQTQSQIVLTVDSPCHEQCDILSSTQLATQTLQPTQSAESPKKMSATNKERVDAMTTSSEFTQETSADAITHKSCSLSERRNAKHNNAETKGKRQKVVKLLPRRKYLQ
jgi:hypothetical protein